MTKYLLIGGRSNEFIGKSAIYKSINKYSKTNKLLYIPYANKNYQAGLNNFINQSENFDITVLTFDKLNDYDYLEKAFSEHEIWFFAGGNYNNLIRIVKEYKIDYLINKYKDNKILCGISAGAILFSKAGLGDRDVFVENNVYYNFKMVDGLSLINYTICPHYNKNGIEIFNDIAKNYKCDSLCLEDDTSIWILDDKFDIIKDTRKNSLFLIKADENYKLVFLNERKDY